MARSPEQLRSLFRATNPGLQGCGLLNVCHAYRNATLSVEHVARAKAATAIKAAQPDMHVHAFSPLEVSQGAATLGLPLRAFLGRLRSAGLGSLPGTAAEMLDDEVREVR